MKQFLLSVVFCLSVVTSGFAQQSGTAGNLTWELDAAGTLTISGTGAMPDYTSSTGAPWGAYRSSILQVNIAEGVTNIGNYAFRNCSGLTAIAIPSSVTSIGEGTFFICKNITSFSTSAELSGMDKLVVVGRYFGLCTR